MESTTPVTQDLRLTAWGNHGLSARVSLRSRLGSDSFWPRSSERLEALNAYLDFDRTSYRIRGGRQHRTGGLGVHYFDGVGFLWKGFPRLRLDAFAGRSLARVLLQPRDGELLATADNLAPDDGSWLFGGEARYRTRSFSGSLLFQRELRFDRTDLYSDRISTDLWWAPGATTLEGSVDLDLVYRRFNEARLRAKHPLGDRWHLEAQVRRYLPYFELWTIWGAFSPVGYTGGDLAVGWSPGREWALRASGGYRDYDDTNAGADFLAVEGDGGGFDLRATWTRGRWTTSALLGAEGNFGASRNRADVSVRRSFPGGGTIGVFGLYTRQFLEYRFGDARTAGGGIEASYARGDVTLFALLGAYTHTFVNRPGYDDYTQPRVRVGGTWRFGIEPQPRSATQDGGTR